MGKGIFGGVLYASSIISNIVMWNWKVDPWATMLLSRIYSHSICVEEI